MSTPFEKFIVQSLNVNEFYVRVASPESVREGMRNVEEWVKSSTDPEGKVMMTRYLFIEDAIREKLERARAAEERSKP